MAHARPVTAHFAQAHALLGLGRLEVWMQPKGALSTIREKLFSFGVKTLSDQELAALLFGEAGTRLPKRVQSPLWEGSGGVRALCLEELEQLCSKRGLGRRRAAIFLAALELGRRALTSAEKRPRLSTPKEIHGYLQPHLSSLRREVFHVLCFNARNVLLRDACIAEGSVNACPVDPREIFAPALATRATALVLAHNHPSGDPTPSELDLQLTRQIAQGARLLGVSVLDHVIVGERSYVSFLERNLLPRAPVPHPPRELGLLPAPLGG
jgi:DNA repair protein RadC